MITKTEPTTWQEAARNELDAIESKIPVLDYDKSADLVNELSIRSEWIADLVHEMFEGVTEQWQRHLAYMLTACGNIAARKMHDDGTWNSKHMAMLLARKQHDYGHGNITSFGLLGVAVRMSDKIARLKNLTARGTDAANEPLRDTYEDIVGYAVIAGMLLNDTFRLELG